jgi:eukaryotic-like serine/threonine-protein kinase
VISGTEDTVEGEPVTPSGMTTGEQPITRGQTIGRYVVLDRLGAGGMGVVYAAYDPELDRKIAVKVLHGPSPASKAQVEARAKLMNRLFGDDTDDAPPETPRADDRLLREAQAIARVSHPNVIAVHDVGEHAGEVFLAMEFIQGRTLGAWLKESPRTAADVIRVMQLAGRGLAAVHGKGLVHRDFKPENVMIGDEGRVVVMDFGLVRPVKGVDTPTLDDLKPNADALAGDLTRTGTVVGTPAYMSPEQHLGRVADARSDQFGFCIALWEGVYRERPFSGDSLASLATSVIEGQRRAPPAGASVPAHVRRVLERGLALDPADRFATMDELLTELARDPTRRNRGFLAVGSVLALGAAVFGVRQMAHARALAACDDEGRSIALVWNDDAKARIEAAFLATNARYAPTSFTKLTPWIDDWTADWARARTDACTAELASTPSIDAPPQSVRDCLDAQRDSLAELVALAAEADDMMVRKSVSLAAGLPAVARCTDPRQLAHRGAMPADPAIRELRRTLTRATALEAAGKFEPALAMAQELLAACEAAGDRRLAARVRYRVGALHEDLGDYAAAERELTSAVFESAELGEDGDAADAAMRLAVVVTNRLARPAEGKSWARWAEVLVERLGEEADLRGARMHNELGVIARDGGSLADARAHQERSLELKKAIFGDDHPEIALATNNLATVLIDLGDYDQGLAMYERAREIYEATLGADHPDTAMPLMNAAEVHWRRDELAAAHELMLSALAINEAAFGADHPRVGLTLGNLGLVEHALGRDHDAIATYERALAIFRAKLAPEHPQIGRTLVNLADVQRHLGDPETARANHERALAMQEKAVGADNAELASALVGLGTDFVALGRAREGLPHLRRALALVERIGEDHPHVGIVLLALAEAELAVGERAASRATVERAVGLFDRRDASARERGEARFLLARAWGPEGDRERVRSLALEARALLHGVGRSTAEIDAWLAASTSGHSNEL